MGTHLPFLWGLPQVRLECCKPACFCTVKCLWEQGLDVGTDFLGQDRPAKVKLWEDLRGKLASALKVLLNLWRSMADWTLESPERTLPDIAVP